MDGDVLWTLFSCPGSFIGKKLFCCFLLSLSCLANASLKEKSGNKPAGYLLAVVARKQVAL